MTPEGELQCVGGVSLPLECLSGREDDSREKNKHRLLLETVLADVKLSDFGAPFGHRKPISQFLASKNVTSFWLHFIFIASGAKPLMSLHWELSILLISTSVFFTFHLFSFLSSITMLILSLQLRLNDCGQKKNMCFD